MSDNIGREPVLDMFIFETTQLVEQLEYIVLNSEQQNGLEVYINEIFRIMHTIKGSSAMMFFCNISSVAHVVEDVFFCLREEKIEDVDYSEITDMVLESIDFIKDEVEKIENNGEADGNPDELIYKVNAFLENLKKPCISKQKENKKEKNMSSQQELSIEDNEYKRRYRAVLKFQDGCEMENIRAFSVINNLNQFSENIEHTPRDIIDDDGSVEEIRKNGFEVLFSADMELEEVKFKLEETLFLEKLELQLLQEAQNPNNAEKKIEIILDEDELTNHIPEKDLTVKKESKNSNHKTQQSYISVSVSKMDKLMDLVGELVISETMVSQNPDLKVKGLQLENFNKATRHHSKIINDIQDVVMSVRMVPLAGTFQKMNRIVRDMCKKLNKEIILEIIGEETEVDKNIIENISDPLMHLIRNAIDHGIESSEERVENGKSKMGKIVLEAKNTGGDVLVILRDDGKGLERNKIF